MYVLHHLSRFKYHFTNKKCRKLPLKKMTKINHQINFYLFRKYQKKFFENIKFKLLKILRRNGYEISSSPKAKNLGKFTDYKINNLFYPILEDKILKASGNKQVFDLIQQFSSNFQSEIFAFYEKLKEKQFKNTISFPIFEEKESENLYFAHYDLLTGKNIGHLIMLQEDNIKYEINIKNVDLENFRTNGQIFYNNGDIYIGKIYFEINKIPIFNDINFDNKYLDPKNDNVGIHTNKNEKNYNQVSKTIESKQNLDASHTCSYNYLDSNPHSSRSHHNNTNCSIKSKGFNKLRSDYAIRKSERNNPFLPLEKNLFNSHSIKNKKSDKSNDDINYIDENFLPHLQVLTNFSPNGEGILIKKNSCEVLHLKNWELINTNNNIFSFADKIILGDQKFYSPEEIEKYNQTEKQNKKKLISNNNNLSTKSIYESYKLIKNAILYDYKSKTKYEGDIIYNSDTSNNCCKEVIKNGKGKLYFYENFNFYEGEFLNNFYEGKGLFFERHNQTKRGQATYTSGIWSNGKLNGKGIIIKTNNQNIKELCMWRLGRLISSTIGLNRPVTFNERIFDFLNNEDLVHCIIIKNKVFFDYFSKLNDKAKKIQQLRDIKKIAGDMILNTPDEHKIILEVTAKINEAGHQDESLFINKRVHFNYNDTYGATVSDVINSVLPAEKYEEKKSNNDVYVECNSIYGDSRNHNMSGNINVSKNNGIEMEKMQSQPKHQDLFADVTDDEFLEIRKLLDDKMKEFEPFMNREWILMEEKNDFKSFYIDEKSGLRSTKTETLIHENINKVKDYYMDLNHKNKYNSNIDNIKILREVKNIYYIKYLKTKSKMLFSARDFVIAEKISDVYLNIKIFYYILKFLLIDWE